MDLPSSVVVDVHKCLMYLIYSVQAKSSVVSHGLQRLLCMAVFRVVVGEVHVVDNNMGRRRRGHFEGLELKRTISTFFKKWAKCTFLVLSNHTLRVRSPCILYLVKDA